MVNEESDGLQFRRLFEGFTYFINISLWGPVPTLWFFVQRPIRFPTKQTPCFTKFFELQ